MAGFRGGRGEDEFLPAQAAAAGAAGVSFAFVPAVFRMEIKQAFSRFQGAAVG